MTGLLRKELLLRLLAQNRAKRQIRHPPEASHATLFKPGPDDQRWTKTGLSQEYLPVIGTNEYSCPFSKCNYTPRQKLDLVCTHIRLHLNIGIGCHYCGKGYWSAEGWKRHCRNIHPDLPKVPEGAEEPEAFENPLGDNPEIVDIECEEADAIDQAIRSGRTPRSLDVEPQFSEVIEEIPTSSTSVCTTAATSHFYYFHRYSYGYLIILIGFQNIWYSHSIKYG